MDIIYNKTKSKDDLAHSEAPAVKRAQETENAREGPVGQSTGKYQLVNTDFDPSIHIVKIPDKNDIKGQKAICIQKMATQHKDQFTNNTNCIYGSQMDPKKSRQQVGKSSQNSSDVDLEDIEISKDQPGKVEKFLEQMNNIYSRANTLPELYS